MSCWAGWTRISSWAEMFRIYPDVAEEALRSLGLSLGFELERTASGILAIMNSTMAETMRLLTVDRGLDPREFTLIAFGGAGPLHGPYLAQNLGIKRVIVPMYPGVFSAAGALMADTRFDYMQSRITYSENIDPSVVAGDFAELENRAREDFEREGFDDPPNIVRSIDLRYYGQNWELEVSVPGGEFTDESISEVRRRFDAEHERQFGWNFPESAFELVNFRVVAVRTRSSVEMPALEAGPMPEPVKVAKVYFDEVASYVDSPFFRREALRSGCEFKGPAIIVEPDSTALVPPGWNARVERHGHIIMEAD